MKTTKAEFLQALKAQQFTESDKIKLGADLLTAIANATENDLEVVETRMQVQVAHLEIDMTARGTTGSLTRTINEQLTTPAYIFRVKNKDIKTLKNNKEIFYMKQLYYAVEETLGLHGGDPKMWRELIEFTADDYATAHAKDYFHKLRMSFDKVWINSCEYIEETPTALVSRAVVYLRYKSKGKNCVCLLGAIEDLTGDGEEKIIIAVDPTSKLPKKHAYGKWAIGITVVAAVIWYCFVKKFL